MLVVMIFQLLFLMFCFFVLSEPWRLDPRKFIDFFKNLDFDSIPNVAHVDNAIVTSAPLGQIDG